MLIGLHKVHITVILDQLEDVDFIPPSSSFKSDKLSAVNLGKGKNYPETMKS